MVVWGLAKDKTEGEGGAPKALKGTCFGVMESSLSHYACACVCRSKLTKLYTLNLCCLLLLNFNKEL